MRIFSGVSLLICGLTLFGMMLHMTGLIREITGLFENAELHGSFMELPSGSWQMGNDLLLWLGGGNTLLLTIAALCLLLGLFLRVLPLAMLMLLLFIQSFMTLGVEPLQAALFCLVLAAVGGSWHSTLYLAERIGQANRIFRYLLPVLLMALAVVLLLLFRNSGLLQIFVFDPYH